MDDEKRGMSEEGRRGDHVEGGFSILLGEESIRAFMSSGDFSSARELDRFLELGAKIEGRLSEKGSHTILAMSIGENRLARDFAVLQISHILAKHGRDVLIVDFDFLSPGLSGLVENIEDQGFLDLLLYGSSIKTVAKPTGIDGVTVIGPGSFPVTCTIPFAKKEFAKVKEFLSRSHSVIIYCSTLYTDDGTINPLASLADSIFLSCRLEEMPEGQFQKNLEDLGSDLPPAELVCFGEDAAGSAAEKPFMPPVPVDDGPAEEGAESEEGDGQEEQYEAAAIEKTAELESDGKRGSGGMNLPRIITSFVVVFVVVFLVWWFMIHKSITDKEGESRTAELVQKQLDVKEMKDRSKDKTGTAEDDVVSVTDGGDVPAEESIEKPADKPAEEKTVAGEAAGDETGTDRTLPVSKPGTVTPAPEGSYYSIHVASFREISRAGTETDYLEKKGYETTVIAAEVRGRTWYRVYVGEYGIREEAAASRLQLLDLSRIGYAKVVTLKNSNN